MKTSAKQRTPAVTGWSNRCRFAEILWSALIVLDTAYRFPREWLCLYIIPLAIVARWTSRHVFLWGSLAVAILLPVCLADGGSTTELAVSCAWRAVWLVSVAIPWRLVRQVAIRLHEIASTDRLTGVLNLSAFRELLEREMSRSTRTGKPYTVVFIDCDRFKALNDQYGHAAGNAALRVIGQRLIQVTRRYDAIARYAGDEFLCLFPETDEVVAAKLVERSHSELTLAMTEHNIAVSFSVGAVTSCGRHPVDLIINQADAAMYHVKRNSGNGVHLVANVEL